MVQAIKLLGQYSTWVVTNGIRANPGPVWAPWRCSRGEEAPERSRGPEVVHHVSANGLLTRIVSQGEILGNPTRTSNN